MRILIHAANLQKGGALQVAVSLLEEFAKNSDHEFHVLAAPPILNAAATQFAQHSFSVTALRATPTRSLRAWRRFLHVARNAERTWKPDAVLTVFGPGLWRPRAPHLMGFANGLYLFSGSRFIRQDWPVGRTARARYALRRRILLRRVRQEADAWWVETRAAQLELAKASGIREENIAVVPNALGPAFIPYLCLPLAPSPHYEHNDAFRVLVMGAAYPNKNLSLIAAMLPQLGDAPVRFFFTLPPDDFAGIFSAFPGDDRLVNHGPLVPADAHTVYAGMDAVLLPSKLETFSAVLLEAAVMQLPLLAPDLPFARELCGDSAQYFDPWSADSAVAALRSIMMNAAVSERLIAAGYKRIRTAPTAAFRAQQILQILQRLAATH